MVAVTVACPPVLFHKIVRSTAANRRARRERGVGGAGRDCGELGEFGFGLGALLVEFGEPGPDAGAHGSGGGPVGDFLQGGDLGVLGGVEFADADGQSGGLGVAAGLGFGVGGGELGGEQFGAAGPEHARGQEPAGDLVELGFRDLDGAGVVGVRGLVAGVGGVVVASPVGGAREGVGGQAAFAVAAEDPPPVGVDAPGTATLGDAAPPAALARPSGHCRSAERCASRGGFRLPARKRADGH
jgi:hypothetical protein